MLNIIYEEDSNQINNKEKYDEMFCFKPNDIRYNSDGKAFYNFVGFIIKNNNLLAVFPKHYFDKEKEEIETTENIKILFGVMKKYVLTENSRAKSDKFFGNEKDYTSDYPFYEFYKIYDYYKKYGIYKEENYVFNKNNTGNVSWKKTIEKSNKIISEGNLIYLPLVSKKQNFKSNFVSECMVFVINYTIKMFPFFIELKPIETNFAQFDFISNKKFVIEKLKKEKNRFFKDSQIKLINNLISFFKELDKIPKGGTIHFKINYFDLIWEKMIHKYLNNYFEYVDEINKRIIFDYTNKRSVKRFEFQKSFSIDESENKFKIVPDHYFEDVDNKSIYVFDSKYYNEIKELNYKQFAYTIMIGNSKYGIGKKLYSILILPGKKKNKMHIILSTDFKQLNEGCNKIIEQYIDVKQVMLNYLNKQICYDRKIDYMEEVNEGEELMVAEETEKYQYE